MWRITTDTSATYQEPYQAYAAPKDTIWRDCGSRRSSDAAVHEKSNGQPTNTKIPTYLTLHLVNVGKVAQGKVRQGQRPPECSSQTDTCRASFHVLVSTFITLSLLSTIGLQGKRTAP